MRTIGMFGLWMSVACAGSPGDTDPDVVVDDTDAAEDDTDVAVETDPPGETDPLDGDDTDAPPLDHSQNLAENGDFSLPDLDADGSVWQTPAPPGWDRGWTGTIVHDASRGTATLVKGPGNQYIVLHVACEQCSPNEALVGGFVALRSNPMHTAVGGSLAGKTCTMNMATAMSGLTGGEALFRLTYRLLWGEEEVATGTVPLGDGGLTPISGLVPEAGDEEGLVVEVKLWHPAPLPVGEEAVAGAGVQIDNVNVICL